MSSDEYLKVADYFVVAGLTDNSLPLEEELAFPNAQHKLSDQRKDPITDICVINKTLGESCPLGFMCIDQTPTQLTADLNHGSISSHNMFLCYRRGKDKPPLIDLGVFYEGLENVRNGVTIFDTTLAGRSANVNNKSGMGSHPIYLTYRRAKESAPQNLLVVTDICIILTNKGEKAPYAFCQIDKNLNKGMIGSSVYVCYKKSMRQVDSISFKADLIARYPPKDTASFPLPSTVPLFCLPMGATIECWSKKTRHPLPTFSSFVLTTETSEKIFGAVVSFYENYPEENLKKEQKHSLGLLRGDGQKSQSNKTVHTNKAICFLSRWPLFSSFRDVLMYIYRLTVSPMEHPIPVERHISHFMENVPCPSSGRPRIQYQMSPMHATILTRPQITPIPLSGASFLALLDDLGPENTITLLTLALTEHKIVIHSLRPAEITCVAEALITLLFPFKWQCTYVPLCPLEMGYVLEAPCPFIVGVDSRYFDLYEPPPGVTCVNLDTNSITLIGDKKNISWKSLPRKPAKILRTTLQKYFKEVKECPREDSIGGSTSLTDPDISRTERHRRIDLAIQESVLKLMTVLMKGYRQFLKPITEAPNASTADPSSLFNIQEFIKSRERTSQRNFYLPLSGTQLFSSFIEERCLTSFAGGGDVTASRLSSLVFFDECIDRMVQDSMEEVHLIESDESLKSEHTVIIMPPHESGNGEGYQYTTFPVLQDKLFLLEDTHIEARSVSTGQRKPKTFAFARRTKQEVRIMQRISKLHNGDSLLWARLLLSHSYGAWFACLPAFVEDCRHSDAALRTAYDALLVLNEKTCFPLPDETFYRMLLHLCSEYNKPALAVRVFQFLKKSGVQLSAITYGLYNKAVLEGTWPASNRDGYKLWQKLRNVFLAIRRFRYGLRFYSNRSSGSEISSDFDNTSHNSLEMNRNQASSSGSVETDAKLSENSSFSKKYKISDDLGDYGYDSMPKEIIKHGTPPLVANTTPNHKETEIQGRFSFERSMEPPNTLDIPACDNIHDNGLKSDETIVNQEIGDHLLSVVDVNTPKQEIASEQPHIPRASPVLSAKKPLTRTGKLLTNNTPSHTNVGITSLPVASVHETACYSSDITINIEECPSSVLEDNVFNDKTYKYVGDNPKSSPSIRINSNSPSAVSSLFGADAKILLSFSDSDQKRHQELCSRGYASVDSDSDFKKYPNSPVHLRDRSGSLFGGSGGGISPLVGQKSLLESSQLKLTQQPARKNFDNLTADDITSPIHFGTKTLGSIMTTKSPNKITGVMESPTYKRRHAKSKEKITHGNNSMMFVGSELMLTSTPLKPISNNQKPAVTVVKQEVERKDISHLLEDPLSPHSSQNEDPLLSASTAIDTDKTKDESQNVSRHLVDEIEVYMKREPLVRCSSDAILTVKQKDHQEESYEKPSETVSSENNLHRKASLPPSPSFPRKQAHPAISRSMTLDNTSSSWFNSGSKFNNLLKATTIGMATKAKKVASELAKDLNETVQASIAYYTPEKAKGSLNDLAVGDSQEDVSRSNIKRLLYPEKQSSDQYSSQSSLRSRDSVHSSVEPRAGTLGHNDKVLRRTAQKNAGKLDRPLSMPPIDSKSSSLPPLASSFLSIPGNREANLSTTSLNKKDACIVDVTISSCSKCHNCGNLIYDEEIMAGWNGDDSNLNTHCPFCNTLFVPFLNVEIQYPDTSQNLNKTEDSTKTQSQELSKNAATHNSQTSLPDSLDSRGMFLPSSSTSLEPVAVPYLSSLVLRKELESLLENEGSAVISTPGFVDHHPIIYWNLVWYFKRLHIHSNLYNLLLQSNLIEQARLGDAKVNICLMWDNLKLHTDAHKPPMYCVWHQLITLGNNNDQPYSYSFLANVKDGIMQDDVRGPLVAVLTELHVQKGIRRSAYREILYLVIVALGKNSIDIAAFDREYKRAYDALTAQELSLTKKCDRPPNNHAIDCRDLFGELDLYK